MSFVEFGAIFNVSIFPDSADLQNYRILLSDLHIPTRYYNYRRYFIAGDSHSPSRASLLFHLQVHFTHFTIDLCEILCTVSSVLQTVQIITQPL